MAIFIIILYFILLLFMNALIKDRASYIYILFYVSFWMISLAVSTFNPIGLYPVSDKVYFLSLLNVFSFFIGFSVIKCRVLYTNKVYSEVFDDAFSRFTSNKFVIFTIICAIIFIVITAKKQMALLAVDPSYLGDIVNEGEQDLLFANSYLSIIYNIVIPSFHHLFLLLFPIALIKKKRMLSLLILVFIASRSLIGGSRDSVFIILVYFVAVFALKNILFLNEYRKKLPVKVIVLVLIVLLLAFIVLIYVTALRHGDVEFSFDTIKYYGSSIYQTFINYSCGPFRAFDYGLTNHYFEYAGGPTLGRSTLSGLEDFVSLFLNRLGFNINPISELTVKHQQDVRFSVSNTFFQFNYAFTNSMIFYYDFKGFGVALFSFLFGMTTRSIIREAYRNLTIPIAALATFFFFGLYKSTFTWFLIKSWAWLYLIILIIWHIYEKNHKYKTT